MEETSVSSNFVLMMSSALMSSFMSHDGLHRGQLIPGKGTAHSYRFLEPGLRVKGALAGGGPSQKYVGLGRRVDAAGNHRRQLGKLWRGPSAAHKGPGPPPQLARRQGRAQS